MVFGKKEKRRLLIATSVALILLIICAVVIDSVDINRGTRIGERSIALNEIGKISLVNEVVEEWFNNPGDVSSVEKLYEQYRKFGRIDYPNPVNISFSVYNTPQDVKITKKEIAISEKDDLSDAIRIDVPLHNNGAEVYNLKTGTRYYYCVTVSFSDGTEIKEDSTFEVNDTPRYLYIDGVRNTRDIGGRQTIDGKKIKQGMVYRGTELDGADSGGKFVITEKGIDTIVNDLNVKHQMDLRLSDLPNVKDMLPSQITHKYYNSRSYMEIFDKHGVKALKEVFSDLAKADNYPMYVHCTHGNDRTGTIVYLMGAVLGISEEDLYREWALSAFFSGGSFSEKMTDFIDTLKSYEGETMKDKVSNYLLSIGITQQQLDSFRQIMLEE